MKTKLFGLISALLLSANISYTMEDTPASSIPDSSGTSGSVRMSLVAPSPSPSDSPTSTSSSVAGPSSALDFLASLMRDSEVARAVSLPGGGIRGVIQAALLEYIEEKTGHSISEIFHMMSGTSTGGLLAGALSAPDTQNKDKARFKASEILNLYIEKGSQIFTKMGFFQSLFSCCVSSYKSEPFEEILGELCGDLKLSDLINDVLITTYDKTHGEGYIFKSSFAKESATSKLASTSNLPRLKPSGSLTLDSIKEESEEDQVSSTSSREDSESSSSNQMPLTSDSDNSSMSDKTSEESVSSVPSSPETSHIPGLSHVSSDIITPFGTLSHGRTIKDRKDFWMRDVLRATSSAPTYFSPYPVTPIGGSSKDTFTALDGGIFQNNPAHLTLIEMFRRYPNAKAYFLMSVGNGQSNYEEQPVSSIINWATQVPDILMNNTSAASKHMMKVMGPQYNKPVYFVEFQLKLPKDHMKMDDASKSNINFLIAAAKKYISENKIIDDLIEKLFGIPKTPRENLLLQPGMTLLPSNFIMIK